MRAIARLAVSALSCLSALSATAAQPASGSAAALVQICSSSQQECKKVFIDWGIIDALDYNGCAPDDLSIEGIAYEIATWLAVRPEYADKDAVTSSFEAASALWSWC